MECLTVRQTDIKQLHSRWRVNTVLYDLLPPSCLSFVLRSLFQVQVHTIGSAYENRYWNHCKRLAQERKTLFGTMAQIQALSIWSQGRRFYLYRLFSHSNSLNCCSLHLQFNTGRTRFKFVLFHECKTPCAHYILFGFVMFELKEYRCT